MGRNEILRIKRVLLNANQREMAEELFYSKQRISYMEHDEHIADHAFNMYNNVLNRRIERHPERETFLQIVEILERG